MSAVPPQLQHLALRIGNAAGLAPDAMASEVKAALRDATAEAGWLPPERRRADHQLTSIHRIANRSGAVAISLHVYGVAADRISSGVNRIYV
jgi:hypothetical protein